LTGRPYGSCFAAEGAIAAIAAVAVGNIVTAAVSCSAAARRADCVLRLDFAATLHFNTVTDAFAFTCIEHFVHCFALELDCCTQNGFGSESACDSGNPGVLLEYWLSC